MQIYVCVKQVPDTAASIQVMENIRIDERMTFIINPYDEHCLTEAAKIRDNRPGCEVIAVCLGKDTAQEALRSALAMGADRGIHIRCEEQLDSLKTARALKAAIDRDKRPDLIFTGREAIDSCGMQTMFRLGALYRYPVLSNCVGLEFEDGKVRATVEAEQGKRQHFDLELPCVLGAGKGLNKPRYPTFPDIVKARKKDILAIDIQDLEFQPGSGSMQLVELRPVSENRTPRPIEGDLDTAVDRLIQILEQEARVI